MERARILDVLSKMDTTNLADEERVAIHAAVELVNALEYEVCICAAVMDMDGKVYRGHRWSDCMALITREGKRINTERLGFITSRNAYISAYGGRQLQEAAGIPSVNADGFRDTNLFPEDLY